MQIQVEPGQGEVQVIVRGPADSEELLRVLAVLRSAQTLWVWDEHRSLVAVAPEDVVWCEVVEDKVFVYTARAMYQKLGYEERGIVPCVFNGIPGVQLVCLEKYLDGGNERWTAEN